MPLVFSTLPMFTPALEFPDQRVADIEHLIAKELARLVPRNLSIQRSTASKQFVVLLTGSTGSLGTYLLRDLIDDRRVRHVYTHNRPSTSSLLERHASSFRELGLDESILASDKLSSLEGHLIDENLGLDSSMYEQLLSEVDVIIHNAWTLDLNGSLSNFEHLISGSMNLINFAQKLQAPAFNFIFSSSNAAVQNFGGEGLVPEEVILDARVSLGIGYGESKYVVERLLSTCLPHACSLRMPQLYGGEPRCIWPSFGWLPRVVKSSLSVGQLPIYLGSVEWLSMECTAKITLDFALHKDHLPQAANLCHPRPVPYLNLISWVQEAVNLRSQGSFPLSLTPMDAWLQRLEYMANHGRLTRRHPALRIKPFLERMALREKHMNNVSVVGGLPAMDTRSSLALSPSLRESETLSKAVVMGWVDFWIREGYLPMREVSMTRL